jgi:hypothetical protein
LRVIEGYGALPAFGLLDQLQVGDTGPAESTRQGNLQRVGLLFSGLAGQSKLLPATSVGLDESSRILVTSARAQELSGATKNLTADNLLIRDQQRL